MRARPRLLCLLLALPIAAAAARWPQLRPERERVLVAGKGDEAVGIVAVTDGEGGSEPAGWYGPQDIAIGEKGELLIADTNNRRVLVMSSGGQVTARLRVPGGIEPWFISPAEPGWLAVVGEARKKLWLARMPAGSQHAHQIPRPVPLPADWSLLGSHNVYDMAADRKGVVYLYSWLRVGNAWSPSLWQVAKGERTPRRVAVSARPELDWASLCRGHDGEAYALVNRDDTWSLVSLGGDGRAAHQWDAASLLDWQTFVGDLVGVDDRGRVYLADPIVPEDGIGPAEQWGDHLYCCSPRDKALAVVDEAEIRYRKGDIEIDPSGASVGDTEPVSVLADGSPVLRMANAKQFRLRFYPPPPWHAGSGT
jgi:hypothetical protein